LPTKIAASLRCTRASTIPPSASAYDARSIVALRSLTASQIVTTVGRCAIAPGSCSRLACSAIDPETPRFTYAEPAGRRAAIRAGHEPLTGSDAPTPTLSDLTGSDAPTPTLSDAPIATYRTAGAADDAAGEGTGVVGLAAAASTGLADRGGVDVDEHAARKTAHTRVQTLPEYFISRTIVLPGKPGAIADTGMRGFDRARKRTAASRGTPFLLVNPNGRQTTANTSYALAA